ncbi:hypothetical protein AVEN_132846-1 [Araneus ventricosus]|uniref:Uncharacterized protein n=1 Tax=Araneus ventricosus TaxID=182803 RepID=A0A4Y2HFK1_ARAVE|nr:hypothetical protein AVEN_132846-1 [Araneus ventricosus]
MHWSQNRAVANPSKSGKVDTTERLHFDRMSGCSSWLLEALMKKYDGSTKGKKELSGKNLSKYIHLVQFYLALIEVLWKKPSVAFLGKDRLWNKSEFKCVLFLLRNIYL